MRTAVVTAHRMRPCRTGASFAHVGSRATGNGYGQKSASARLQGVGGEAGQAPNTSHQIPGRVIEADGARAAWVPDPRSVQLIQPGAVAAVITVPSIWFAEIVTSLSQFASLWGKQYDRSSCWQNPYSLSRGEYLHSRASKLNSFTHRPQTGNWRRGSSPHRAELPVSQFPRGPYLLPNIRELTRF
jgi:hypothetical protein